MPRCASPSRPTQKCKIFLQAQTPNIFLFQTNALLCKNKPFTIKPRTPPSALSLTTNHVREHAMAPCCAEPNPPLRQQHPSPLDVQRLPTTHVGTHRIMPCCASLRHIARPTTCIAFQLRNIALASAMLGHCPRNRHLLNLTLKFTIKNAL